MPMIKADSIISTRIRDILPDDMKNIPYTKPVDGMIGTITKVVFSTYEVQEKDEKGNLVYDPETKQAVIKKNLAGAIVYNTTAYVLMDGKIMSFNGKTALNQLVSISGDYAKDKVDVAIFDTEPTKVKIITVKQKYGNTEHPKQAFEPLD